MHSVSGNNVKLVYYSGTLLHFIKLCELRIHIYCSVNVLDQQYVELTKLYALYMLLLKITHINQVH